MAGEFDLHQLLAGPIVAMNDAQADAAASFYELFDQFAFEPPAAGDPSDEGRRLRTISFVAERATTEGVERRRISMPLIQMIPIGGVAIDSAKLQFSLAINAEPDSAARSASAPTGAQRAVALKARIAPTALPAAPLAGAGNLQVEIVLKQVDLPAGYLDMIAETQGGMSRIVRDQPPAAVKPPEEAPLFVLRVKESSERPLSPEQPFAMTLDIEPNAKMIGSDGLRIAYLSEPADIMTIKADGAITHLGSERTTGRVEASVRAIPPGIQLIMLLEGTATSPDGTRRRHSERIAIPQKRAETGKT